MDSMLRRLFAVFKTARSLFKSRRQLVLENLALRQQLVMIKPSVKRPRVSPVDRLFWVLFSKYVDGWRAMLHTLHPDTVVRWHREGFRRYWNWKSRRRRAGRPPVDADIRKLIRQMQATNMGWGAPATARPESMVNCSSSVSIFLKLLYQSTCFVTGSRPHRPGGHFSKTTLTV